MLKKNILIIDDSALMRRVLFDIINSDERFIATDMAINGLEAMNMLERNGNIYDAILLDINMPKMNGIEFLAELKEKKMKATVIVVSTLAKKDAKETILALELGAHDFVTKPESFIEIKSNLFTNKILDYLAAATKLEARRTIGEIRNNVEMCDPNIKVEAKLDELNKEISDGTQRIVALACSTGGPKALHTIIPKLPKNLDSSILIVQHMPEGFTKSLADRLNELSEIRVKEAEHGEVLSKGTVYIAKGGFQMRLKKRKAGEYQLFVSKEPTKNGLSPCADIMYDSLSDTDFDQIVCVVLTGMGNDGTNGIMNLNNKKFIYVIAQNEETSVVYGMPKVIKESGLVDEVLPLNEISDAIIRNVGVQ